MGEHTQKILVIEDDIALKTILTKVFIREGLDVTVVASSAAAKEELLTKKYTTLLTDLFMDGEDGFALLESTREQYPHIKLCAMTACPQSYSFDYVSEAQEKGALKVFEKPLNWKELIPFLQEQVATEVRPLHTADTTTSTDKETILLVDDNEVIHWTYKEIFNTTTDNKEHETFDTAFAAMFDSSIAVDTEMTSSKEEDDFLSKYCLKVASSKEEALLLLEQPLENPIKTVIMDINLGTQSDGIEVAKEILTQYLDMHIVFSSGLQSNVTKVQNSSLPHEHICFLPKPFTKADLINCLKKR